MYLYVVSIHSDENEGNLTNKVVKSSYINNIYWSPGVKSISSRDILKNPIKTDIVCEENNKIELKLKGLRYLYFDSEIKDIELILKEYYESFLKIGYTIQVNVYNLKRNLPLETFYADEYVKDKKINMFSEYLDEELESFFNMCLLSNDEFNNYLDYLSNMINYLNSEKIYKKINDSNESKFSYKTPNIFSEEYFKKKIEENKNTNKIPNSDSYLLEFKEKVYVKKTRFIELNKVFIPEIKSIKPFNVDFSLGLRLSDINNLLENLNKQENELEKEEEEKKEQENLETNTKTVEEINETVETVETVKEVEDEDFIAEPKRVLNDDVVISKFEYIEDDEIHQILCTKIKNEEIIDAFLNYFTTEIVTEALEDSTNKTPKWYIQNEFCHFVINPIDYIRKLNLTFHYLNKSTFIKPIESIKINDLMTLAKDAINKYMNDKKSLVLKYYDVSKIELFKLLKNNKNIRKNMYELTIHSDIENKFWNFLETPQDKSVNEETIHTLIELYSSKCLEKSPDENILSSNLHKEFLGFLKFYKFSYYIDLISNISFTIIMKKLGYKTKRTSAGNAYNNIKLTESFTEEWISSLYKDSKVIDEIDGFIPDWLTKYEKFGN